MSIAARERLRGLDAWERELCAEARPCPFCGGDEILVERVDVARAVLTWLVCARCGACIRGQGTFLGALERWNERK